MFAITSVSQAITLHGEALRKTIETSVKLLLEQKHLYQSVEVELEKTSTDFQKTVPSGLNMAIPHMAGVQYWPWVVTDNDSLQALMLAISKKPDRRLINWAIPDVKMFCKVCDRIEAFNSVSASNQFNKSNPTEGGLKFKGKLTQVYCISYLCQSCKSLPEVFLLRRHGTKLTLCGRAPIEHVPVPKDIPKEISRFYSDAIVAHNSGQTLAALFLLRTACEQWARRWALATDMADVAIDKYMDTLPADFKGRFSSIRNIYGELSVAIHSASASAELFEKASAQFAEHFAARALFKLGH